MPTVINNPSQSDSGSGIGLIVGILVAIVVVVLLIFYGLPLIRGQNSGTDINVQIPDLNSGQNGSQNQGGQIQGEVQ